jgi:hypothetical protein
MIYVWTRCDAIELALTHLLQDEPVGAKTRCPTQLVYGLQPSGLKREG